MLNCGMRRKKKKKRNNNFLLDDILEQWRKGSNDNGLDNFRKISKKNLHGDSKRKFSLNLSSETVSSCGSLKFFVCVFMTHLLMFLLSSCLMDNAASKKIWIQKHSQWVRASFDVERASEWLCGNRENWEFSGLSRFENYKSFPSKLQAWCKFFLTTLHSSRLNFQKKGGKNAFDLNVCVEPNLSVFFNLSILHVVRFELTFKKSHSKKSLPDHPSQRKHINKKISMWNARRVKLQRKDLKCLRG